MANRPTTYNFEPKKSTPTSWRQLACRLRGKSDVERGQIGAELVSGQIPLAPPGPGVAAKLCKTTPYHVQRALGGNGHSDGHHHVHHGERRHGGDGRLHRNGNGSLAEHMLTSTPTELFEAARAVGVDLVWDLMIMAVMQATDRQEISVPDFLQARAKRLGLYITADAADAGYEKELDLGPFMLRCGQTGHHVWVFGLPAEGIADALDCYERELQLPPDKDIGEAWRDFGSGWRVIETARTNRTCSRSSTTTLNDKIDPAGDQHTGRQDRQSKAAR